MIVKDWTLYYEGQEPVACQAPCTLYSVLYESGRIPDPFYGLNDQRLTALADKDCAFEAQVEADEALLSRQYVELTFQGLDTICRISLNGRELDRVKNMHRAYTYDVKELLRPGKNTLRLEFASPTRYFAERHAKHYLYTNDGDTIPGAAHLRKALYQSGWDWGPALPDMGIYRPVTLEGYDVDRIGDVAVRQHHREDGSVEVEVSVAGKRGADTVCYASMDGKRVELTGGTGRIVVENPRLWWVRGYGEQNLYDLEIEMTAGGRVIDRCRKEIGLRTLTVSTAKDRRRRQRVLFCQQRREDLLHGSQLHPPGQPPQPGHPCAAGRDDGPVPGRQLQHPAGLGRRLLPRRLLLPAVRPQRHPGLAGLHGRLRQRVYDRGV